MQKYSNPTRMFAFRQDLHTSGYQEQLLTLDRKTEQTYQILLLCLHNREPIER